MPTGTILRIVKGEFGFLAPDGGERDLFFHKSDVSTALGSFGERLIQMRVQYELGEGDRGPRAERIRAEQ